MELDKGPRRRRNVGLQETEAEQDGAGESGGTGNVEVPDCWER